MLKAPANLLWCSYVLAIVDDGVIVVGRDGGSGGVCVCVCVCVYLSLIHI